MGSIGGAIGGLTSGIGAAMGANEQAKGYKAATGGLQAASRKYNPFVTAGKEGFDEFQSAILGQDMSGYENFMQRPDIQYQINQGMDMATQGLAGRGALNSGAAMRQLQGVGQQAAGQGYQQYLGNLGSLANYGMQGLDAQTGLSRDLADTRISLGDARAGRSQAIGNIPGQTMGGYESGGGGGMGGFTNLFGG